MLGVKTRRRVRAYDATSLERSPRPAFGVVSCHVAGAANLVAPTARGVARGRRSGRDAAVRDSGNVWTGGTAIDGAINGGVGREGGAGAGCVPATTALIGQRRAWVAAGTGGAVSTDAGASAIDPTGSRRRLDGEGSESSLTRTPPQLYAPPADAIDGDREHVGRQVQRRSAAT